MAVQQQQAAVHHMLERKQTSTAVVVDKLGPSETPSGGANVQAFGDELAVLGGGGAPDTNVEQEVLPRASVTGKAAAACKRVDSCTVVLTSGSSAQLAVGDHIAVRTKDKTDPCAMAAAGGWRVYLLQLTSIEVLHGGRRVKGYGTFYRSSTNDITGQLQQVHTAAGEGLQLQNTTVACLGPESLCVLTGDQQSGICSAVRMIAK
eukprot:gene6423-6654_t